MKALRALLPAPVLSLMLLAMWLMLARSASAGQLVIGMTLALVVPLVTRKLRLSDVYLRRPVLLVRYCVRVATDVVWSNISVARDVALWRWRRPASRFVTIPLELCDPVGLAMLALVTTIVPGTVWSELAADRRTLVLHVWDVDDDNDAVFVARFKHRYERPLREIFE